MRDAMLHTHEQVAPKWGLSARIPRREARQQKTSQSSRHDQNA